MTITCQQVWEYAGRCPDCGELIVMDEEHFVIPQEATEESIKAEPDAIEYACACGSPWDEEKRMQAYREGDWVCVKGESVAKPVDVGFHLTGFVTPDMRMADIACTIVAARAGDLAAKIDLAHGIKAIDFAEELSDRKEDSILMLRDERPAGQVPTWADAVEISIDTQDNGFWFRLRAWQFGSLQSALVKAGFVENFAALDTLIYESDYLDADRRKHRIGAGIIDSAGHRTAEVYDWCRRPGSIVIAAKGAPGRKTQPVTVSKIDHYPGSGKAIPGGLRLYHIDTHFHKDELARRLAIEPSDPGCFWLHSGYTASQLSDRWRNLDSKFPHNLEGYAKQMCAEYRDERGIWQCPPGKANHLWDCESNGLALVLYLGLQHRRKKGESTNPETHPDAQMKPIKSRRW
jgi:phage terminase large subunit GpA-like protein